MGGTSHRENKRKVRISGFTIVAPRVARDGTPWPVLASVGQGTAGLPIDEV